VALAGNGSPSTAHRRCVLCSLMSEARLCTIKLSGHCYPSRSCCDHLLHRSSKVQGPKAADHGCRSSTDLQFGPSIWAFTDACSDKRIYVLTRVPTSALIAISVEDAAAIRSTSRSDGRTGIAFARAPGIWINFASQEAAIQRIVDAAVTPAAFATTNAISEQMAERVARHASADWRVFQRNAPRSPDEPPNFLTETPTQGPTHAP
jgi:hypothetical protein